jgi:hypothetical protein
VIRKAQLGEAVAGRKAERRNVPGFGQCDQHGPVERLLLASERPDDALLDPFGVTA